MWGNSIFEDEMRPIVEKQNSSMKPKDIDKKLSEMWKALSEDEKIPYYVKSAAYEKALKVFEAEKEQILTQKLKLADHHVKVFCDNLGLMWFSLTKEERKPYIDKVTISLTLEQVMKRLPRKHNPWTIFCEEKGVKPIVDSKFWDMWCSLTKEEKKPYGEKANAKVRECLKHIEPLALKALNDIKTKTIKEREKEKLKNELFAHMEKINQKEQEIKEREAKLNEREYELNKKEARLIKMEEYLNNLFLL